MVTDIPKPKVTQNFFDYVEFLDKTDDTHRALALATNQKVHLIDFLNQASPTLTELFGRDLVGDNGRNGVILISLFSHPPGFVRIPTILKSEFLRNSRATDMSIYVGALPTKAVNYFWKLLPICMFPYHYRYHL